jgi:hypothetical protein
VLELDERERALRKVRPLGACEPLERNRGGLDLDLDFDFDLDLDLDLDVDVDVDG